MIGYFYNQATACPHLPAEIQLLQPVSTEYFN